MKLFFILIIKSYRFLISPLFAAMGCRCRFHPTCSEYAIDAFKKVSLLRALWLITIRIMKCAPWHSGGVDIINVEKG